jgi:glucose-1-phosphate cytidylyltransferase
VSVKVVILCGGKGTRLREETEFRPKPMVEVGGRPLLWHIQKIYAAHGYTDFLLCLGYRGFMIKEYFLDYEAMNNDFTIQLGARQKLHYHGAHTEQDFTVTMAETGLETATGGRLKRVERYLDDDTFMLTYGDGVADIDVRALVDFHHAHGRIATVTAVRPTSRFGVLDLEDSGHVRSFAEKPMLDGCTSAGFFVFSRRVFDYLTGDDCVLEEEPLARLAREGQLVAYRHPGFFFAMDTYREYKLLNDLWDSGRAPWKIWQG